MTTETEQIEQTQADIVKVPLNEAIELVRDLKAEAQYWAQDLFQIGTDRGWDLGGPFGVNKDREFRLLIAAIEYLSQVEKAYGRPSYEALIKGIEHGCEECNLMFQREENSRKLDPQG